MVVFRCLNGLSWYDMPGFRHSWCLCRALHTSQTWPLPSPLIGQWFIRSKGWVIVYGFSAWSASWDLLHVVTLNQFMSQVSPEQQKITLHNISSLVIDGVSFDDVGIVQVGFHEFNFHSSVPLHALFQFVLPCHLVQFVNPIHVLGLGSHSRRTGELYLCAVPLSLGDTLWFFLMRGVGSRPCVCPSMLSPTCWNLHIDASCY